MVSTLTGRNPNAMHITTRLTARCRVCFEYSSMHYILNANNHPTLCQSQSFADKILELFAPASLGMEISFAYIGIGRCQRFIENGLAHKILSTFIAAIVGFFSNFQFACVMNVRILFSANSFRQIFGIFFPLQFESPSK